MCATATTAYALHVPHVPHVHAEPETLAQLGLIGGGRPCHCASSTSAGEGERPAAVVFAVGAGPDAAQSEPEGRRAAG